MKRCIKDFFAPSSDENGDGYFIQKLSLWEFYFLGWTDDNMWGVNKGDGTIIQIRDVYIKEYFEEVK